MLSLKLNLLDSKYLVTSNDVQFFFQNSKQKIWINYKTEKDKLENDIGSLFLFCVTLRIFPLCIEHGFNVSIYHTLEM